MRRREKRNFWRINLVPGITIRKHRSYYALYAGPHVITKGLTWAKFELNVSGLLMSLALRNCSEEDCARRVNEAKVFLANEAARSTHPRLTAFTALQMMSRTFGLHEDWPS